MIIPIYEYTNPAKIYKYTNDDNEYSHPYFENSVIFA
jgi:hypothetical protein